MQCYVSYLYIKWRPSLTTIALKKTISRKFPMANPRNSSFYSLFKTIRVHAFLYIFHYQFTKQCTRTYAEPKASPKTLVFQNIQTLSFLLGTRKQEDINSKHLVKQCLQTPWQCTQFWTVIQSLCTLLKINLNGGLLQLEKRPLQSQNPTKLRIHTCFVKYRSSSCSFESHHLPIWTQQSQAPGPVFSKT